MTIHSGKDSESLDVLSEETEIWIRGQAETKSQLPEDAQ